MLLIGMCCLVMYMLRRESSVLVSKHLLCIVSQFFPGTCGSAWVYLVPKESLGMRLFGCVFAGDIVTASKGYGLQNDVNRVFYFQRANA